MLACGPGAVLSHRAALALWELRPAPRRPYDVTVVARGRSGPAGVRVHCVPSLAAADRTVFDGIPVTSVAREMLDYSATATANRITQRRIETERARVRSGLRELLSRVPPAAA